MERVKLVSAQKEDSIMCKRIMRLKEVLALVNFSRETLYRRMAAGEFPRQKKLGGGKTRAVGWRAEEVYDWLDRLENP